MSLRKIELWGFRCERCGHQWIPRGIEALVSEQPKAPKVEKPKVCPKCKSPYWDRPRRNQGTGGS